MYFYPNVTVIRLFDITGKAVTENSIWFQNLFTIKSTPIYNWLSIPQMRKIIDTSDGIPKNH